MFRKVCLAVVATLPILALSSIAVADDRDEERGAGTVGHVTARTEDREVIDVDACPRINGSFKYVECGSKFRVKINESLCTTRGKGNHKWLYQVADSKTLTPNTARCK
jgi:hypothetical protein